MKFRKLSLAAAAMICGLAAANAADIFPVPQNYVPTDGSYRSAGMTYRMTGADMADADAVALLERRLAVEAGGSLEIVIGEAGDAAVASVADKIPSQPQGYYLKVGADKIIIAGRDGEGTYYGVQSFLQLAAADEVTGAEVTDWPDNAFRGIVEGYYGNPWSHEDRMDMMQNFMGHARLNVYIYGPKNDAYHKSKCFEAYPAETAAQLSEVARAGLANKVHFVWAMHPGNNIEGDNLAAAVAKFKLMYDLGIRQFGIFFDDIGGYDVNKQVAFINHINREIVHGLENVAPLIVCPSQYNQGWAGDGSYLKTMGETADPDVEIMWTGSGVVDQKLGSGSRWFTEKSGRKPYIWLNYPCNDHGYGNHALQMSPYDPADSDIATLVSGYTANPMEYYEASKVGLYGIADFTWNAAKYDAWSSWEKILGFMMPDHKDAFRTYCMCNISYPQPAHGVRIPYDETPDFKAIINAHSAYDAETAAALNPFFSAQVAAGKELLGVENRLTAEIREFIIAYQMQGERGLLLADMRAALDAGNGEDFLKAYMKYDELTDSAERNISRNYPGSLRSYKGNSGNQYVEPYITSTINGLVNEFRDGDYDYPDDLFPAQIIPSGKYHIKVGNMWLSNGSGAAANTPGNPTLRNGEDDVNAERQVWSVRYDMETGRYSIRSAFDDRYVNEICNFGVNAYSNEWNTYNIYGLNGKFAIQNAGRGGSAFWRRNGTRLERGGDYSPEAFIFEFIPSDGSELRDTVVTLVEDANYVIKDAEGRVLRRGSDNSLTFVERPAKFTAYYKFKFTLNANGRYEIRSARADKAFINEKGNIVTGAFYANWNTYRIFEMNGAFAIQNFEDAGTDYWFVSGNRIDKKRIADVDAYNFYLENLDETAIDEITAEPAADGAVYDLQGRRVTNPRHGIYIVNGRKVVM